MADTNNRQFSVMVDNGGVLSYPQNFIAANQLASFGSDVVGTFKQIRFGSEDVDPSTITFNATKDENLGGYNTNLIISNNSISGYISSIMVKAGSKDPYSASGLEISYNSVMCSTDIILHTTYTTDSGGAISLNSFDTTITCGNQFTVNANSASLPANTTIGGVKPATFGNNVVGTLKQLNILNPVVDKNNPPLMVGGVNNKFANFTNGNNDIVIIDGMGHTSQTGLSINNIGSGNAITVDGSTVDAALSINSTNIKSYGSVIKINGGTLYENSGIITVEDVECSNSGIFNINGCTNFGPIISVDGEDYLAQFAKKTDVVDLTSEQTITGNKAFTGNVTIGGAKPATFGSNVDGTLKTLHVESIELTEQTQIYSNSGPIYINSGGTEFVIAPTGLAFNSYNGTVFGISHWDDSAGEGYWNATFDIPQRLRVFNTVTKTWTNTYKYTYLAQDANGNITLAISDTHPSA